MKCSSLSTFTKIWRIKKKGSFLWIGIIYREILQKKLRESN